MAKEGKDERELLSARYIRRQRRYCRGLFRGICAQIKSSARAVAVASLLGIRAQFLIIFRGREATADARRPRR